MVLRQERTGVDKRFFELCSKVVEAEGLHVYDMDYLHGSHELRLFVINPETNTAVIDDCMKIDRALTPFIEEEEWMPAELTLEVSSPGVYRNLTTLEHFENVVGQRVQLHLKQKLDEAELEGLPRKLKGQKKLIFLLTKVNEDSIDVELENISLNIKYDEIKKANLED
ncbi:MAG: ribosome maturation factor RimP [Bacteriovoracaceae bacterium]